MPVLVPPTAEGIYGAVTVGEAWAESLPKFGANEKESQTRDFGSVSGRIFEQVAAKRDGLPYEVMSSRPLKVFKLDEMVGGCGENFGDG